ncbi:hypothetical protein COO60DRAFT_462803 [Scenedesmus sp. NREL 46B-D3]|nr:hypothetical protein COO60DRAFT_462803 [Scenedesmus sp. NREL 46B-D3]
MAQAQAQAQSSGWGSQAQAQAQAQSMGWGGGMSQAQAQAQAQSYGRGYNPYGGYGGGYRPYGGGWGRRGWYGKKLLSVLTGGADSATAVPITLASGDSVGASSARKLQGVMSTLWGGLGGYYSPYYRGGYGVMVVMAVMAVMAVTPMAAMAVAIRRHLRLQMLAAMVALGVAAARSPVHQQVQRLRPQADGCADWEEA